MSLAVPSEIASDEAGASVPPPAGALSPSAFRVVVALFVCSGAAGLIDQVCFSKYLTYVVGSTAYAVSAVLAAFMAGLALGAHVGGRLSERARRPLVFYGTMEIAAGVTIALAPFAFERLAPAYVWLARQAGDSLALLSIVRWVLASSIVFIPTFALGTTLPLLSPALGDVAHQNTRLGRLYAANTLGGALGALGAAFLILPVLGLRGTLWASASASAGVGVIAVWLGTRGPERIPSTEIAKAKAHVALSGAISLLTLGFLSGALIFAVEVTSTHLLAVIIGNSAFAFGLILAIFLGCLFVGASWAPCVLTRLGEKALPWSLLGSAALLGLTLPAWDRLPYVFADLGRIVTTFAGRELVRSLVAFSILALPVTCMGLTFPLLLQKVAHRADVGALVGRITAINTVGAVIGALATGYVLLPRLGSQGTLVASVLAFALAGVLALPKTAASRGRFAALAVGIAAVALLLPRWSLARLTAGANVYFDSYQEPKQVLFAREDVEGGVTTVTLNDMGVKTLYTNGKFQGNDGWELQAQRFFAHYPSMFLSRFDSALVIGLGTGTTLGTYTGYPWRKIDVVEISPSIVNAAREHFSGINRASLDDPRVEIDLADGRNHLLLSDERYDLIGMELSSVWFAGASNLYSAEYYRLVRQHLAPGGIFQQWVQLHHIQEPVFATLLNTLRQEFSHVALFYGGGQGILVASEQLLAASQARLRELEALPSLRALLPEGRSLASLVDDVLLYDEGLDQFLAEVATGSAQALPAMISTDDNLYLEYETPRGNVLPWSAREALVERLRHHTEASGIPRLLVP